MAKVSVEIRPCNCESAYQDKAYGKGQRVHNIGAKTGRATCTVCGFRR